MERTTTPNEESGGRKHGVEFSFSLDAPDNTRASTSCRDSLIQSEELVHRIPSSAEAEDRPRLGQPSVLDNHFPSPSIPPPGTGERSVWGKIIQNHGDYPDSPQIASDSGYSDHISVEDRDRYPPTPGHPRPPITAKKIANWMRSSYITSAQDQHDFLPCEKLREIISPDVLRTLFRGTFDYNDSAIEVLISKVLGQQNTLGNQPQLSRHKIIAILVLMDKIALIEDFIRGDIKDDDLPLKIKRTKVKNFEVTVRLCKKWETDPSDGSKSVEHLESLECLDSWSFNDMEDFEARQTTICTPFFELPGDKLRFYNLRDRPTLPFLEYAQPQVQEGASRHFAVKELHSVTEAAYREEIELFEKIGVRGPAQDPRHLLQLQFSYLHGDHYFLVFPWADGNLREFWRKNHSFKPGIRDHVLWFFKQCKGLVGALHKIHHYTSMSNPKANIKARIDDLKQGKKLKDWGRHGDIKPENILWFQQYENMTDFLVISDFGLTRFNTTKSRSKVPQDAIAGYSGTYRPPELDLGTSISPKYDIWSLGCVFLEFVSWFILGDTKTRDDFTDQRLRSEENTNLKEDKFFVLGEASDSIRYREAKVKPSVVSWIAELHAQKRCTEPLHELLDFIEFGMLQPDPKDRSACGQITREITCLLDRCKREPEYATRGKAGTRNPARFQSSERTAQAVNYMHLRTLKHSDEIQAPAEEDLLYGISPASSKEPTDIFTSPTLVSNVSGTEGLPSRLYTTSPPYQGMNGGLFGSGSQFDGL
ncbi:Serine/threonine protein kinase [Colletotrichum higginsianum IMI 349063]|uniref:Serine/threonine protein kinase n=1 Tax=Colletotrichum higginsianum (strain IMI 349063) TaxID=759273 RepID=A0A1B7YHM0_COLHI|nr:Serine/threonine protein kinase [Colletotrichum higginsianum IMI 349063]OBR11495.1 Serine/threonine protein kinase [Colletotrichum higginsianum IMI 349063]